MVLLVFSFHLNHLVQARLRALNCDAPDPHPYHTIHWLSGRELERSHLVGKIGFRFQGLASLDPNHPCAQHQPLYVLVSLVLPHLCAGQ
jgi:hypothetical protein